jgi:tetratricopeptide (TPR) repeat protein
MMEESTQSAALAGKRIAFMGQLGGLTRREAQRFARELGALPVENAKDADVIVIGADQLPIGDHVGLLSEEIRQAAGAGDVAILGEAEFLARLDRVDACELAARRHYTPAMLADLLSVSVSTVRRWWRRGLIVPVKEVRRLPYFDFQEVATARRLAQLLASGMSPTVMQRQLSELARYAPHVQRPLAQLQIMVEGKRVLLRQGEGLIDPGGQWWIDFEAFEQGAPEMGPAVVRFMPSFDEQSEHPLTPAQLLACAENLEDEGQFEVAVDAYRAALAAGGARADVCFQLAELLYLLGDVKAARERYYMAIELDEDFVEARANLGCVLAETGQPELAIAAFRGALAYHPEYPDVHYHLARTLDDLARTSEAHEHWEQFLRLAPDSPWADEARARLG